MALVVDIILPLFEVDPQIVMAKLCATHPEILGKPDKSKGPTPEDEPGFRISYRGMVFDYSHVSLWDHAFVGLEGCVQDLADAWRWIKPFTIDSSFRQAFVYDVDYRLHQLMDKPEWFQSRGFPCPDLPIRKNLIGKTIFDTSRNPGRRVIREGYVEFVSALMWLGRPFWKLSGANHKKVLAQSWLKCKELPNDVLQIRAWPKAFTSAEGEEADIQKRLRDLLFPNHEALDEAKRKSQPKEPLIDLEAFVEEFNKEYDKELKKKKKSPARRATPKSAKLTKHKR